MTKAAELREKGLHYKEIVEKIENMVQRMRTVITLDSVEMLKSGGRLSASKALASSIMGIKPIIIVNDGALEPCGKARGRKKSIKMLVEKLEELDVYKRQVYNLYNERYELYKKAADKIVENKGTLENVVKTLSLIHI